MGVPSFWHITADVHWSKSEILADTYGESDQNWHLLISVQATWTAG